MRPSKIATAPSGRRSRESKARRRSAIPSPLTSSSFVNVPRYRAGMGLRLRAEPSRVNPMWVEESVRENGRLYWSIGAQIDLMGLHVHRHGHHATTNTKGTDLAVEDWKEHKATTQQRGSRWRLTIAG